MIGFDPMYFLFIGPGLLLSLWAQWMVQSAFSRYSQEPSQRGIAGHEAARMLLDRAGIRDVEIVAVPGTLTDHYNPMNKTLALSEPVYASSSIAAIGVATHEAGHAIQHARMYAPLWLRSALVWPTQIGSTLSPWILIGGMAMNFPAMIWAGIILFCCVVAFQLVTLPVEFDASNRAKQLVVEAGIISPSERRGVDAVLNAAALTYVAAFVTSLMTLIYYLYRSGLLGGRSREE